jgi:hypothetical protein
VVNEQFHHDFITVVLASGNKAKAAIKGFCPLVAWHKIKRDTLAVGEVLQMFQ